MSVPIPSDMLDLFDEPALGHVAYTTDASQVVSFPLWVDHDGTHLLSTSASPTGGPAPARCS